MNFLTYPLRRHRVLMILVPAALLGLCAYLWSSRLEPAARSEMSDNMFVRILGANAAAARSPMSFQDKDGDLVADPPDDSQKCIAPEVLTFSYVAPEAESVRIEVWAELIAPLAEKTARAVQYVHYPTVDEPLEALKKGELQIACLSTDIVPAAVQSDGFVPLCTFGRGDGSYGHTMQVIVPADSPVQDLGDLKGRKITFTRPDSHSGCKALLILLSDQEDLRPDRDYTWGFSLDHKESIRGIAAKEYEAAPVASDILARLVAKGEVDASAMRKIYEFGRFPSATFGYVHNLTPQLRTAVRQALLGFNLTGTALEGEFDADATRLVPVDYENDWANARRIDQLAAQARAERKPKKGDLIRTFNPKP